MISFQIPVIATFPDRPPTPKVRWFPAPEPWQPSKARELLDLIDRVRGLEARVQRLRMEMEAAKCRNAC